MVHALGQNVLHPQENSMSFLKVEFRSKSK